jgi:hypothetical protein
MSKLLFQIYADKKYLYFFFKKLSLLDITDKYHISVCRVKLKMRRPERKGRRWRRRHLGGR